jgi:tRNA splicing endonuclease
LVGKHALLAPSQPHWLNYDDDKLFERYTSRYAQDIGTILHSLAETLIRHRLKLKKTDKLTVMVHLLENGIPRNIIDIDRIYENFMNYVNDAVGFRLTPEQILYYSEYCFGTADAISYRDNFLRIHDYKSGTIKAKIEQLLVYAALFCLEYKVKPGTLAGCELRIYQNDEVLIHRPEANEILPVMDIIIRHTNALKTMNEEV